jgi:hypothetical protein
MSWTNELVLVDHQDTGISLEIYPLAPLNRLKPSQSQLNIDLRGALVSYPMSTST